MILTGPEIRREVVAGQITIIPFSDEQVNPNSYNYRLGPHLILVDRSGLPVEKRLDLRAGPLTLQPRRVYLGHTSETIGSTNYVTMLNGRSSIGRLGMFLNFSADLGQLGPAHKWTLEIMVVQPLIVYLNIRIGQATFWKPSGRIVKYKGEYAKRNEPTPNLEIQHHP